MGSLSEKDILLLIIAIFLPPLTVFLKAGVGIELAFSFILWIFFVIPGILYAWYIVCTHKHSYVTF